MKKKNIHNTPHRIETLLCAVAFTGMLGSVGLAADTSNVDPAIQEWLKTLSGPPIYALSPADARKVLDKVQEFPVTKLPSEIEDRTIPVGPLGSTRVRIVRPHGTKDRLPVVMYFHGGGWILGDKETHDRLIREIANGAHATVVFVDYEPSPEAKYPVAIEEDYAATKYVAENAQAFNVDASRLAVAGDSVGGNMVAVTTLLAKERGGPKICFQLLFYPVTDANFDNGSYNQFADGPWLTRAAMKWFWDAYLPDEAKRKEPTASPLQASLEQLKDLPPALVITDENDVLRDEGEAYAHKLANAGVKVTAVRYLGGIHDFVMLNPISATPEARGAIAQANDALRKAFANKEASQQVSAK
jgi:acetyl esterase